jgi:hypothetical protein
MKKNKITKRLEKIGLFYELASEGRNLSEISEIMGLDNDELLSLKKEVVEEKSSEIKNKPIEHIYFEYYLNQLDNVVELSKLIKGFDGNSRNYGGVVSAIRARSEILDKILKNGQELGVIKKTITQKSEYSIVTELSSSELRKAIIKQSRKFAKITTSTTDDNIVNLQIGNLHYGEAKALPEVVDAEIITEPEYIKPKKKKKKKKRKKSDE